MLALLKRASEAWTPAKLYAGGFIGDYWDAYDKPSLNQLSTGLGDPVLFTGDPAGKLEGQRGSKHLIQATSGSRPDLAADGTLRLMNYGAPMFYTSDENIPVEDNSDAFFGFRVATNAGPFQIALLKGGGTMLELGVSTSTSYSVDSGVVRYHPGVTPGELVTAFVHINQGGTSTIRIGADEVTFTPQGANGQFGLGMYLYPDSWSADVRLARGILINRALKPAELSRTLAWLEDVPV